jgi:hypothetical protein
MLDEFGNWNTNIPGHWSEVKRVVSFGSYIARHVGDWSGVYRIVGLIEDNEKIVPARIERALGTDTTGTLYIGCAIALAPRLREFSRFLRGGSGYGSQTSHKAAAPLRDSAFKARFPLSCIGVTWLYDQHYDTIEGNLLMSYQWSFGETPPLNKQADRLVTIVEKDGTERHF